MKIRIKDNGEATLKEQELYERAEQSYTAQDFMHTQMDWYHISKLAPRGNTYILFTNISEKEPIVHAGFMYRDIRTKKRMWYCKLNHRDCPKGVDAPELLKDYDATHWHSMFPPLYVKDIENKA